jgi:RNA polymerase sigma-70 factor (ECF subfamily)
MTPDATDDLTLVELARTGDRAAFRQLVERHQQRAFRLALGILRNRADAEDVCQEAFLRAYHGLGSFAADAQFFTWLYRIVVNLCIDQRRKQRVVVGELDERTVAAPEERPGFDPRRRLEDRRLGASIGDALERLSPAHRRVIVLREVEGLSYREIARAVGCSIGTVMSRLFHARRRMQHLLLPLHDGCAA